MPKKSLSSGTKAMLLNVARGECYNPECYEKLIVERSGEPIVNFEYAHIRDESLPKEDSGDAGWRYFPSDDLSQDERNNFRNIILLCRACHKLIDKIKPKQFSVELLHEWKSNNESKVSGDLNTTVDNMRFGEFSELLEQYYKSRERKITSQQIQSFARSITGESDSPIFVRNPAEDLEVQNFSRMLVVLIKATKRWSVYHNPVIMGEPIPNGVTLCTKNIESTDFLILSTGFSALGINYDIQQEDVRNGGVRIKIGRNI